MSGKIEIDFASRVISGVIEQLLNQEGSYRNDAERWRYARTILSVEDIEKAYELCGRPRHRPEEVESERADKAIDIARGVE